MRLCCWTGKCWKRDGELSTVSAPSSVWGVPASTFQNSGVLRGKSTPKDHSLQYEWGYRFVLPRSLQSSGITPPRFAFSITPGIPSYHIPDHKTCGTSSSSASRPLSKHTIFQEVLIWTMFFSSQNKLALFLSAAHFLLPPQPHIYTFILFLWYISLPEYANMHRHIWMNIYNENVVSVMCSVFWVQSPKTQWMSTESVRISICINRSRIWQPYKLHLFHCSHL